MEQDRKDIFRILNNINVNDRTEKKNGLTYLSWAWAWAEVKKEFPNAIYTIYENKDGWNYHTDNKTAWVKTGVTIEGLECIEYLPIMDYRNKSINVEMLTSFDVNKAIQRSLTKACARHGLGLYVYAGEDLPESESINPNKNDKKENIDNIKEIAEMTEKIKKVQTISELEKLWLSFDKQQQNQYKKPISDQKNFINEANKGV